MPNSRLAIGFNNGLGNMIFLSAAVKVLRNWGYDSITLVTDDFNKRNYKFAMDYGKQVFDEVVTKYDPARYDKLFVCGWSMPQAVKDYIERSGRRIRTINWNKSCIHEVQAYLAMVGASWHEFDGYIMPVSDGPILRSKRPRIALANPSGSEQAEKKAWNKFPELSKKLESMGFTVVLLGWKGELEGCDGIDYRGKLSIAESAKVLSQCDLLIAASTALTVVADAVKTPVILIEGPMFTARAHPIMSRYSVVRRFISCAPCFQTGLWNHCKNPTCMNLIQVGDVLQKMFKFMPELRFNGAREAMIGPLKYDRNGSGIPLVEAKVAYCISCCDRYHVLNQFFESFKESNPLPGTAFIWNDASTDPRIQELINSLEIPGVEIRSFETPFGFEKESECKIASTRVGNLLFAEIRKAQTHECYDYLAYMDSDVVFKKGWLQRSILTLREAGEKHKISNVSPLNNLQDSFQSESKDPKIYESSAGKYRLRGGSCINYVVDMNFFMSQFGYFDVGAMSSDVSKASELWSKGYRSAILVPSMVQHIGATESTFRHGIGVIGEDFK